MTAEESAPAETAPPLTASQPTAAQPPTAVLPPPVFAAQAPAPADAVPSPFAAPNPYAAPSAYASPSPYPAPSPYGAPGPYGAPTTPLAYGYPGPGTAPMPGMPGTAACRICGGFPAVDVTVRGHQGLIVLMRFLSRPGPYCRVCGTATVREMSQRTLVRGWWGYLSPLFTLIALLRTRSAYQKIRQLPPPAPGTHGPQLDQGTPLTKRGAIWMLLLPVLSVAACITLVALLLGTGNSDNSGSDGGASVLTANGGDCLRDANGSLGQADAHPDVTVLPCSNPRAQYQVLGRVATIDNPQAACASYRAATSWFLHQDGGNSFALCLAPKDAAIPPPDDPSDSTGGSTGSGTSGTSGSSV
ncbi:hypothetical protein GCM10010442_02590 [Kitasatospora kifunensis]